MSRLRVILVSLLLFTAGCTTTLPPSADEAETPTFTGRDTNPGLTPNVEILIQTVDPVQITVVEQGATGRGVVLNETYNNVTRVKYDGERGILRKNGDYRVVLRINGTTRWDEEILHYETYQLRIETNGTVTVTEHTVA